MFCFIIGPEKNRVFDERTRTTLTGTQGQISEKISVKKIYKAERLYYYNSIPFKKLKPFSSTKISLEKNLSYDATL
jgi:hypothetical protein